ncbi:MAG: poly-gamma-glutamate hydrolase family protein, partial [Minisyncoccia bacterium]
NRDYEYVMVGGLHQHLAKKVEKSLVDAGFSIKNAPDGINGDDPNNVCNLGQTKKGVQLEISRKLRDRLVSDRSLSNLFSEAIASCL